LAPPFPETSKKKEFLVIASQNLRLAITVEKTMHPDSRYKELISHLPTFMRLANLITYAKLVRAMDLASDQDYPETYTALLLKLENWVHNYKESLLS
jgi:hypothetical protein